jgi:CheY-like chemotaxis protein
MAAELQCLLLTRDSGLLELVDTVLEPLGIGLEIRTDAASAMEISVRRHLDGFVLDCDDVDGARDLLDAIRKGRCNRMAAVLAVSNGASTSAALFERGATFVVSKPVQRARLESHLAAALPMMLRENRRYFRYPCDIPVEISSATWRIGGRVLNVSEGGMAVRIMVPAQTTVQVRFELPGTEHPRMEVTAEVVWTDGQGTAGVRFLHMPDLTRRRLQSWLSTLESQMMFRDEMAARSSRGQER